MAICQDCGQDMIGAPTCTAEVLLIRGMRHRRARWRPPRARPDRACGDCGVAPGGVHHLGCDLEDCPACGRQLITCGCGDDPDGEETDVRARAEADVCMTYRRTLRAWAR
jgi:hypothetical protein